MPARGLPSLPRPRCALGQQGSRALARSEYRNLSASGRSRGHLGEGAGSALPGRTLDLARAHRRHPCFRDGSDRVEGTGLSDQAPFGAREQPKSRGHAAAGRTGCVMRPRIATAMTAGCQRLPRLARGEVERCVVRVRHPIDGSLRRRTGDSLRPLHRQEGCGRQQECDDGVQRPQAEPNPLNSRQGSTRQIR